MNIPKKIEISDIKSYISNLGKNLGWVFLVMFLILVAFELIEIKQSVKIILDSNKEPIIVGKQEGVRINFNNYDKVIFRIEQAQSFEPSNEAVINPFGLNSN